MYIFLLNSLKVSIKKHLKNNNLSNYSLMKMSLMLSSNLSITLTGICIILYKDNLILYKLQAYQLTNLIVLTGINLVLLTLFLLNIITVKLI